MMYYRIWKKGGHLYYSLSGLTIWNGLNGISSLLPEILWC